MHKLKYSQLNYCHIIVYLYNVSVQQSGNSIHVIILDKQILKILRPTLEIYNYSTRFHDSEMTNLSGEFPASTIACWLLFTKECLVFFCFFYTGTLAGVMSCVLLLIISGAATMIFIVVLLRHKKNKSLTSECGVILSKRLYAVIALNTFYL